MSSVSQFSCCSYLPSSYETVASILHTSSTDAGHPRPSTEQPRQLITNEVQPHLREVDAEILCSSEAYNDPLISIGVGILPPTDFSDTAESRAIAEENVTKAQLAQKPECSPSDETHSLVANLRRAASEQEKEREEERERQEREWMESIKRAEKEERNRKERGEEVKKEKQRLEREKEEVKKLGKAKNKIGKSEKERIEVENEERNRVEEEREEDTHKKKRETETKQQREDINEGLKKNEKEEQAEKEKKIEKEKSRKSKDIHGETPQWRKEALPVPALEKNNQKVDDSQPNHCLPLRKAELEDIAYDESESKNEESRFMSDPKLANVKISHSKVLTGRADSVPAAKIKSNKREDSVSTIKKTTAEPGLRSLKKGKSYLKHEAIPEWLREDDDEEIAYERGQEDLGSIWLAELYMEGEAG